MIAESLKKLQTYIEQQGYKGYDPYDGLTSPLFRFPVFKTNKYLRLYSQQIVKRFPVNVRPVLLIPKGYNPVTLGLCIQGYSNLLQSSHPESAEGSSFKIHHSELKTKIEFLIDELVKFQSKGYSGVCWGYDFDWQSGSVAIPAFGPTVVATGIITNALFEYYKLSNNARAENLVLSSAEFVLNDLNRTNHGEDFCFSYSPFDNESVYNANMKAVRLLSQAYSLSNNPELLSAAKRALNFVLKSQNEDGSWFYSNRISDRRIDNYHTGYVLDCIKEYIVLSGDSEPGDQLKKGYGFYIKNFITPEGIPKFYNNNPYPVDSTSAAQSIITLCNFADTGIAFKVAEYMIENMQSENGYFYFRKYKHYTNKTSFMRWSNAWMFMALSSLIKNPDK